MGILRELHQEYQDLNQELFGDNMLAVEDPADKPKWDRYNQLQGLFRPELRTAQWKDPRDEAIVEQAKQL